MKGSSIPKAGVQTALEKMWLQTTVWQRSLKGSLGQSLSSMSGKPRSNPVKHRWAVPRAQVVRHAGVQREFSSTVGGRPAIHCLSERSGRWSPDQAGAGKSLRDCVFWVCVWAAHHPNRSHPYYPPTYSTSTSRRTFPPPVTLQCHLLKTLTSGSSMITEQVLKSEFGTRENKVIVGMPSISVLDTGNQRFI